ncbi:MAG: C1 family peptidase [bacterium]|nr:C1 family peptidase [bacterium]
MKAIFCILIALTATFVTAKLNVSQEQETTDHILDNFISKGNTKELFKVWHILYKRDYDYNSELGLKRYKTFLENYNEMIEENKKGKTWKFGLNEFSDRTVEELEVDLGVREMKEFELQQMRRNLVSYNLDDYNDEEKSKNSDPPQHEDPIDWTEHDSPVRSQGRCGSCWTFSTMAAVETNYYIAKSGGNSCKPVTKEVLATQQLVDCNDAQKPYGGCKGGWMKTALRYLIDAPPMREADYKYEAKQTTCRYDKNKVSPVVVEGYETARSAEGVYDVLQKGPLAQCVNIQRAFYRYRSGIYNPTCDKRCHHAITLVGYGKDEKTGTWFLKAKNSWGSRWGEAGYFRVAHNHDNAYSCLLEDYRYSARPKIA